MAKTMRSAYAPKTFDQKVAYLIEECGELQSALGKSLRWGFSSCNPELPVDERVTNRDWVLAEMVDVERGIRMLRMTLVQGGVR